MYKIKTRDFKCGYAVVGRADYGASIRQVLQNVYLRVLDMRSNYIIYYYYTIALYINIILCYYLEVMIVIVTII